MLILEIVDGEILAFYKPPGASRNVGGYIGRVYPGGSFKGLDYGALLDLGPGRHEVLVAETAASRRGEEPPGRPGDDEPSRELRHALFLYEVGAIVGSEVCRAAAKAMTAGNQARVAELLGSERWRRLFESAQSDGLP